MTARYDERLASETPIFHLTVRLNDDLREFIEERTKAHGLESADEHVEFMLRMEILRLNREHFEVLIEEGIQSGPPIPVTKEFRDRLRARIDAIEE